MPDEPDSPEIDIEVLLSSRELGALGPAIYRQSAIIFSQGDPADTVYYVQRGTVRLSVTSREGKAAVVDVFREHEFFGEGAFAPDVPVRTSTATALTDCQLLVITRDGLRRMLQEQPAIVEVFLAHLLTRNAKLEEDLVDQMLNSSERRLARVLLTFAKHGREEGSQRILPKVSQAVLAEMIGTTRSRVNVFMNKFRKLGFIEYNGELKIHESLANVVNPKPPLDP